MLICNSDKHKIRENNFGVTWCVKCGRLFQVSNNIPTKKVKKLEPGDIVIFNKKK